MDRAGLAVDSQHGRAFVINGHFQIAVIDLRTLSFRYHNIGSGAPLGSDTVSVLQGRYLGGGLLAVAGFESAAGTVRSTPSGLVLIDTAAWSARIIDPSATAFVAARGLVLAYGFTWESDTGFVPPGMGLSGHTLDAALRFHVLGDEAIAGVRAIGSYAYVSGIGDDAIVDIDRGQVKRRVAQLPDLLDPAG